MSKILKSLSMGPIWTSVLVLALARGALFADTATSTDHTSAYNYAGSVTFTVRGYAGGESRNFPVYVRVSEAAIPGFSYDFLRNGTNDLVFLDSSGLSLDYEMVKWDPAGESDFWVKLPKLNNDATVTMCWNLRDGCAKPSRPVATAVWSDYVGVWHMDEEITSATAATTVSADVTGHGHAIKPLKGTKGDLARTVSAEGAFGNARVNDTTASGGKGGNGLFISDSGEFQFDGVFTLSFWIKFDSHKDNWPQLVSGRYNANSSAGVQVDLNNSDRKKIVVRGDGSGGTYTQVVDKNFDQAGFVHLAFVYNGTNAKTYSGGVLKIDETVNAVTTNLLMLGNNVSCGEQSVYGKYDEVRLYKGVKSAAWIAAEHALGTNGLIFATAVSNDTSAVLQNEWKSAPSVSKTVWEYGTRPQWEDFNIDPLHGTLDDVTVVIYDRSTGAEIGRGTGWTFGSVLPSDPGAYRVDVLLGEQDGWGALAATLDFQIATHEGSHSFAVNVARILLANDDYSVDGGEVEWQGYDDEEPDLGIPYWRHLDSDGNDASTTYFDYWSDSYDFNLGGGTRHIYHCGADTNDWWDLRDVRIGNTFNNGEILEERGVIEEDAQGLAGDQNYLPWNPDSQGVLGRLTSERIGPYHRYVGHIVLQNTKDASVVSPCYTNGIGTIYFDAVNGWTNNIHDAEGAANYQLVVEVATQTKPDKEGRRHAPLVAYTSTHPDRDIAKAYDPWYYADWQPVPMHVLRFDGDACTDLGERTTLTLDVAEGGSYARFYRVYAPVANATGSARFRIRRVAIDETQSYLPDGSAYILVDNVICSSPTQTVLLEPCGTNFTAKAGKSVIGREGAFDPPFPAAGATVHGRAKATLGGGAVPAGVLQAATMHYRWHYAEQQTTGWLCADLDTATLVSRQPLALPPAEGDIDFWFDLIQQGNYYAYADYSGTGLGLAGLYTEEITAVTNRQNGADWFVRTRAGKSDIAEMKLLVKTSAEAPADAIDMLVAEDGLWRGYYRMTNVFEDGIWWRIEPRNRQTAGAQDFAFNTNRWYESDWSAKAPNFPAAGRLSACDTNGWSRMSCNRETGYLMFQVDETSLGVTAVRSDYQDFNHWNDAGKGYFSGSSTETNGMAGTSADTRRYSQDYGPWAATPASDDDWSLDLSGHSLADPKDVFHPGYEPFGEGEWNNYFAAWQIGKGMWVYGKYLDPACHVALQMAGCGEGYAEFSNHTQLGDKWPRGVESVSFHSRIAQTISPEFMAYNLVGTWREESRYRYVVPSMLMTNYTFMTRVCFDMKNNKGFSGNAAVSLFANYVPGTGAYEARWEQIQGTTTTSSAYPTEVLEPKKTGQRLVLSRWDMVGSAYQETVLYAVTNSASFNYEMPTMPYVSGETATNNLMPFCISVYRQGDETIVLAGVRITAQTQSGTTHGGVSWNTPVGDMKSGWFFAFAVDGSDRQLASGSYGALVSNCEGMLLTPQWRDGITYPSDQTPEAMAKVAAKKGYYSKKTINSVTDYVNCYDEMALGWWGMNRGRMATILNAYNPNAPFGFNYVQPYQTVDVYVSPFGKNQWSVIGQVPITDFGQPGPDPDHVSTFYYTSDCDVRLRTGGKLGDYRTDVAIYDIDIRQWRGYDSCEWDTQREIENSRSNFVFTTGWITNGTAQLSARRTEVGTPCSIRSPLMDGYGGRGKGLGSFGFSYLKPQANIRLKVQLATNVTYSTIQSMTYSLKEGDGNNQTWHTVTNLCYADLWSDKLADGATNAWSISFGYHGVRGVMRVIVDPDLVEEVADETDPSKFGAIRIVKVVCSDEPDLDKGCWWGWNLQTIGDSFDTERRMFLPDATWDIATCGQSLALNNSVTADIDPEADPEDFKKHMPFVQSPTFTNNVIGQISFKVRKYDLSDYSPDAKVVLYGAPSNPADLWEDEDWVFIAEFPVTNTLYETFTCKTDSESFYALRLGVVGVEDTLYPPEKPVDKGVPLRVMIDEVTVSEAVRAVLAFRNVGAFRSYLEKDFMVPGVTTKEEQPLCNENWGVQAELYATMLGDEIDRTYEPRVRLHWFVGKEPWGYANWKGIESGSAYLAQAEGSNYVYRSGYNLAPDAVITASSEPGTVVQYMLEVEYQILNSTRPGQQPVPSLVTNWLSSTSWSVPEWYAPVDYNAGQGAFAAFNILDTVAPGWAWINEVNLFGTALESGENSDKEYQYVEVCVPAEADITGWRIRFLEAGWYDDTVTTNWVARFGDTIDDQAPGCKKAPQNIAKKKVFRLLGSKEGSGLSKTDGSLDGVWNFSEHSYLFWNDGTMDYIYDIYKPFGIQLVRSSGVIESSVVVVGQNKYGRYAQDYNPTNIVEALNRNVPGSRFFYAAEDNQGAFRSGSVTASRGESESVWTNQWACSPGYINTNFNGTAVQDIDPDHPTPHGDTIIVYASVDTKFGHVRQEVGGKGSKATNETEIIILKRGSDRGTNIVYTVDPWYELKSVVTNDWPEWTYKARTREYTATIGKGASNNVTVVATADVDSLLREKGLTDDNAYTPAAIDWLVKGTDAYGNKFKKPGEIALADVLDMNDTKRGELTLTQMYWLDMDPTVSNLALKAGFADNPTTLQNGNVRMNVFIMITNRNDEAACNGKFAWAPYILRGLDPDLTSWDYALVAGTSQRWTSETFKVTGILANGLTKPSNRDNWIPLRWFVFDTDSFYTEADEAAGHRRFTSDIEIVNPKSISSAGADAGWYDWFNDPDHPEHANTPVYEWFSIDERLKQVGVEVLQKENYFK